MSWMFIKALFWIVVIVLAYYGLMELWVKVHGSEIVQDALNEKDYSEESEQ